ncbi:MAG: DNA-binding response regulator [Xanthomonadales bacterium]|nr:DNA-binding response regulator [Xanthomonadales bacterium]|tara:strand:- start:499 stop:1128 length:630 start_codon:yes stop_codon:yes gene_type:complete
MIRVLIADDHAIVREGLKRILADDSSVETIAEAADGQEAARLVRLHKPDVVLLDISMPGRSGIDALADIQSASAGTRILILSMHPEDQYAIRCLRDGADGYLTKESAPELLLGAIRKIHSGGKYISPMLAEKLAQNLTGTQQASPHEALSDRELQVLIMIGAGDTVSGIADKLCVSVKTVSTYRARILEKMGMENNAQLMRYAMENGLT